MRQEMLPHSTTLPWKTLRVEHEDNANAMGRSAGRNMAGNTEPYNHLPSFIRICSNSDTKPSAKWSRA